MFKKTGVFICHCGGNISDIVNIAELTKNLSEEGVGLVRDGLNLCSREGQDLIRDSIGEKGLERVVIAACSPKLHEGTFRECVSEAGLNPNLMDRANIREQCAWIESGDQTNKAADIVRSSVYAIQHAVPAANQVFSARKVVAVIGGGIAGITAALNLAKLGVKVILIEKSPSLGGNMMKIGKVISPEKLSEDCAMCSLSPLMEEVSRNRNVTVLTSTEVTGVKGRVGNFTLEIESGPSRVDPDKCSSCGRCTEACPVTVPDEWNAGLSLRRAIYRPFLQSVPASYTIDAESCVRCGKCASICPAQAIDLRKEVIVDRVTVSAIVVATGHQEFDPQERYDTGYGQFPEVLTQTELARLLAVNGPTNGKLLLGAAAPKRVVMVQCVGSRDCKPGAIPHCSKICCIVALKHASYIKKHFPSTEVTICYTDMRVPGTYENYYLEAQERGVRFIRGRVGEVKRQEGKVLVRVEDTLGKGVLGLPADMVALSCAILPSQGTVEIAQTLGINSTPELFIQESHPKLEPGSTSTRGIFVCGTAAGAKDIGESVMQASTVAMRVCELVLGEVEIRSEHAVIDASRCNSCNLCLDACPSGAIFNNGAVTVDLMSCNGLGGCVSKCPEHAITLIGCSDAELLARVDGCLGTGGQKVVAFLDREIGYVTADSAGANRMRYPCNIRIISVPSVLRLEPKHLLRAFEKGAIGVFLGDGTVNARNGLTKDKVRAHVEWLRREVARAGIDPLRVFYYEAYLPHYKGMVSRLTSFNHDMERLGPIALDSIAPQGQKRYYEVETVSLAKHST